MNGKLLFLDKYLKDCTLEELELEINIIKRAKKQNHPYYVFHYRFNPNELPTILEKIHNGELGHKTIKEAYTLATLVKNSFSSMRSLWDGAFMVFDGFDVSCAKEINYVIQNTTWKNEHIFQSESPHIQIDDFIIPTPKLDLVPTNKEGLRAVDKSLWLETEYEVNEIMHRIEKFYII